VTIINYFSPPCIVCYTFLYSTSSSINRLIFADELFQTPPSSPPSEVEQEDTTDGGVPLSEPVPPHQLHSSLHSLASLQRRLSNSPFERYLLSLSDLQILVGKAEENWKEVTRSGQSSLHLLDRFTLSVRIQR
jgi:vacuolar protein sorting-associated protein 13D